jgi:RNA polymerase sigma-70 factor (ECF subfamily)
MLGGQVMHGTSALPLVFAAGARVVPEKATYIEPRETDAQLVQRARRGDRWAEEALYRRHGRTVTRLAARLLARSADAEDVVQDTFITAFGDLDKLRDEGAFGGWVTRIALRQVHRRYRRRRVLRALGLDRGDDDLALELQVDPAAGPEVVAAVRELSQVLDTLGARARIAWTLRYVEGYKLEEVAHSIGVSLATAKRVLAAADARVREHVSFMPEALP